MMYIISIGNMKHQAQEDSVSPTIRHTVSVKVKALKYGVIWVVWGTIRKSEWGNGHPVVMNSMTDDVIHTTWNKIQAARDTETTIN
jgi:hypothetical protein